MQEEIQEQEQDQIHRFGLKFKGRDLRKAHRKHETKEDLTQEQVWKTKNKFKQIKNQNLLS